ncbi:MAG: hypothetical protein V3V14_12255, partial [Saprospiraceae bacterium]
DSNSISEWFSDLTFYMFDLFFIPDIYEILFLWIRKDVRLLTDEEKQIAKHYFKNAIDLSQVRIDVNMSKMVQKRAQAFVTFHTIHYNNEIPKEIFIHELVHIWQYQQMGSVYIYRALKAQKSKEGYDYGGVEGLYNAMLSHKRFIDFNFEQQGEIFEDFCKIQNIEALFQNQMVMATYQYFIGQVNGQNDNP